MTKQDHIHNIFKMLLGIAEEPDARLIEQDLVDKFGVSRTPIRDSLKELEIAGVISRRKNRGITIRDASLKDILEMYQVRAVLESLCGSLAAGRITDETISKLGTNVDEYNRVQTPGSSKHRELDLEFHQLIADSSGNQFLQRVLKRFFILERGFLYPDFKTNAVTDITHERILDALERRDPTESGNLLRRHSEWVCEQLLRVTYGHSTVPESEQEKL